MRAPAEEDRKNDDLGNLPGREGLHHVLRDERQEDVGDLWYTPELRIDLLAELHSRSRPEEMHHREAEGECDGRGNQIIADDFRANPTQTAGVIQTGDPGQQVEEDEGNDRHHEKTDEEIAKRLNDLRALAGNDARYHPDHHEDQDLPPEGKLAVTRKHVGRC